MRGPQAPKALNVLQLIADKLSMSVLHCNVLCFATTIPSPGLLVCCLMLQAPAGQPPDVSARLLRACNLAAGVGS